MAFTRYLKPGILGIAVLAVGIGCGRRNETAAAAPAATGVAIQPAAPAASGQMIPPADPAGSSVPMAASWQAVMLADIRRDLTFDRLPSDEGLVTPIADPEAEITAELDEEIQKMRAALPEWKPGRLAEPVQKTRNILYAAAVADLAQATIERHLPLIAFELLKRDVPKDDLIKILYWIALHPADGDESAIAQATDLGLPDRSRDTVEVRQRAAVYGVKMLGRLIGEL